MKTLMIKLAALALIVCCLFSLTSCFGLFEKKPELDLEDAADNLEDKKYTVNGGKIGEVTQYLYDTLTGIQWGKVEDKFGWTLPID